MNRDSNDLLEAESRIEEKHGTESKACFNEFVVNALDDNQELTFDEIIYVAELFVRGQDRLNMERN